VAGQRKGSEEGISQRADKPSGVEDEEELDKEDTPRFVVSLEDRTERIRD
jgi:hypothetical protein